MKKIMTYVVVALSLLSMEQACYAGARAVTDADYSDEVRRTYDPVVLEFWAPYCPSCREVAPVVNQLADEYAGKVKFLTVNTEQNSKAPDEYRVKSIPAFFYIKDGAIISATTGAKSKENLKRALGLPDIKEDKKPPVKKEDVKSEIKSEPSPATDATALQQPVAGGRDVVASQEEYRKMENDPRMQIDVPEEEVPAEYRPGGKFYKE